ncbi:MAG: ion channel [Pseudomonadota bacterium]
MGKFNQDDNFVYLTLALLGLLLALPLFEMFDDGPLEWMTRILVILTLLVTYLSLDFGYWWGRFVLLVLFMMIATSLVHLTAPQVSTSWIQLTLMFFFFGSVAYSASRRVLFRKEIDTNRIVGSIAVYLLLGLIWAMLYLLVLELEPGAINGIEYRSWENNFFNVTYFSFVTLTTLGYGDISPAHPTTTTLAFLQAIAGPFYMSVVVASLVGARKPKLHSKS